MDARYLRVKNWREYQHYKDRRPPWIKLMRALIDQERDFREQLSEGEQWQLVRLWLYASGSETVMLDEKGQEVPLIAFDEKTLRIGIRTLKRIPLEKFVRLGWLEVIHEEEIKASFDALSDPDVASTIASALASTDASTRPPKTGSAWPTESTEAAERTDKGSTAFIGEPMEVLIAHISDGDARTPTTIRGFADKLPPAAFGQCLAQLRQKHPRHQARYAVGVLKRMVDEGQYAA